MPSLIPCAPVDRDQLSRLILTRIQEKEIKPFKGQVPLGLGRATPKALMFKVTCRCGVTAILSVDVPPEASDEKIREMVPHLAGVLDRQAQQFQRMPCAAHARMSFGGARAKAKKDE